MDSGAEQLERARSLRSEVRDKPPRFLPYMQVATRFRITVAFGLLWAAVSTWIALPWINDLADALSLPVAIIVVAGIAILPGYLNAQLVSSLLLDHPAPLQLGLELPPLTLLIAARDEEDSIGQTISYALEQDYRDLRVIVIDNGSSDETPDLVRSYEHLDHRVRLLQEERPGKSYALNTGLAEVETPLVATIDADTLLMPGALKRLVSRMLVSPADTVAVAGCVLVRNSRQSSLSSAQEWDYFLGIASIKREQALLQATLVAQGAFSVFTTDAVRAVGGWPDSITEDIVLTWAMIDRSGRTGFEPTAIAFTVAPTGIRHFVRQRRRWARGMIDGLRKYGRELLSQRRTYSHSVATNIVFPYLDLTYSVAVPVGLILALNGNFMIIGPMTIAGPAAQPGSRNGHVHAAEERAPRRRPERAAKPPRVPPLPALLPADHVAGLGQRLRPGALRDAPDLVAAAPGRRRGGALLAPRTLPLGGNAGSRMSDLLSGERRYGETTSVTATKRPARCDRTRQQPPTDPLACPP